MDSYQAIYDGIRSKLSNGDVGQAVDAAVRDMNLSFYFENAMEVIKQVALQHERPSAIYRPKIYPDGNMWCALYGENLQEGVAGFGKSPAEAMAAFDAEWALQMPEKVLPDMMKLHDKTMQMLNQQ